MMGNYRRKRWNKQERPGREAERRAAGEDKQNVNQGDDDRLRELMTGKEMSEGCRGVKRKMQKESKVSICKLQPLLSFATLGIIMISCFRSSPR